MVGGYRRDAGRGRAKKSVDPFYKSKEWIIVRQKVLKRDGHRCVSCGRDVSAKGAARVDHIMPRRKFPDLALHLPNLRTLCIVCDNARHTHDRARHGQEPPALGPDGLPVDGSWS